MSHVKIIVGLLLAALLIGGCSQDSTSESAVSTKTVVKAKQETIKKVSTVNSEEVHLDGIFKDVAKIAPNDKYLIMIFERDDCKYCKKLRGDIANNSELKKRLANNFSTYSLDTNANKMHKIMHEGKFTDVDTKSMIDIYGVTSTPTIIFSDKSSKSIFVVPGYMPTNQFLVTLDFVQQGLWLNKDRKNGEVYEELKKFYIAKGIIKDSNPK